MGAVMWCKTVVVSAALLLAGCGGNVSWLGGDGQAQSAHPTGSAEMIVEWAAAQQARQMLLATGMGALHVVEVGKGADKPLIVYCGDGDFRLATGGEAVAQDMAQLGPVLLFDYPGNGRSAGYGSAREYRKAQEAIVVMVSIGRLSQKPPVVFWGRGTGGGVCAAMAAQADFPSRLVLENSRIDPKGVLYQGGIRLPDEDTTRRVIDLNLPVLLTGYTGAITVLTSPANEGVGRDVADKLRQGSRHVDLITLPGDGAPHAAGWQARIASALGSSVTGSMP